MIRHYDKSVGSFRVRVIQESDTVSILVTRSGHMHSVHVLSSNSLPYALDLAETAYLQYGGI